MPPHRGIFLVIRVPGPWHITPTCGYHLVVGSVRMPWILHGCRQNHIGDRKIGSAEGKDRKGSKSFSLLKTVKEAPTHTYLGKLPTFKQFHFAPLGSGTHSRKLSHQNFWKEWKELIGCRRLSLLERTERTTYILASHETENQVGLFLSLAENVQPLHSTQIALSVLMLDMT